jgi:uncharacterized membrane protein
MFFASYTEMETNFQSREHRNYFDKSYVRMFGMMVISHVIMFIILVFIMCILVQVAQNIYCY